LRDSSLTNLTRYATILLKMGPCVRVFGQLPLFKDSVRPNSNAEKPKKEQKAVQEKKGGKKGGEQAAAA